MPADRQLVPFDKAGYPLEIGKLLWSSAKTPWSGFRLEIYRLAERMRSGPTEACANVAMCLSGISRFEVQVGKTDRRAISTEGAFVMAKRDFDCDSISWSGSTDILVAELDLSRIATAIDGDYFPSELPISYQFFMRDSQLTALLLKMMKEARSGSPAGTIYGQSMSFALAAYILGRYTEQGAHSKRSSKAKLSAAEIARIDDYVNAHLSKDISLHQLAQTLELSAPRFSELLKNTLDITPHQYVLRARIFESFRLLSSSMLSISEIAQMTGFADQSHLTAVFKKITQITPGEYQRAHRNPRR